MNNEYWHGYILGFINGMAIAISTLTILGVVFNVF